MKQTKKGLVEIPATTLSALKNMLFSADNGIDLATIINDVTVDCAYKDLTAINVALAYKGVKVDIDECPRYQYEWRNRFYRYDYTGYSLILGCIKAYCTLCEMDAEGNIKEGETTTSTLNIAQWDELTTEIEEIKTKIAERTK